MADFKLGDEVLVNNKYKASIEYIGTTSFAEGVWYGLELEREIGKHEGTVLGVTYFTAAKKRGTFVKRENITAYDASAAAAAAIQSAARGALAKSKVKQEVAWRAFNALDADDEAKQLERQARLVGTSLGAQLSRPRPSAAELDAWERALQSEVIPKDFAGATLSFPLTTDGVWQLTQDFMEGKPLHYKCALQLLNAYRRYADGLPNMVEVAVAPGERLTICGDTHGQLQDLLAAWTINGVPSLSNRYLMNGDFVDRGDYGCEIVLLLMAYAILHPGTLKGGVLDGAACMLNRGNHETHAQNVTGGFLTEVLRKYATGGCATFTGESSSGEKAGGGKGGSTPVPGGQTASPVMDRALHLYDAFQSAFDAMPISSLVYSKKEETRRVFVVHGGLLARPGVMLAQIAGVKRKRDIPYGLPGFEDKLFEDLMWSDPRTATGTSPSDRGAGVFFGADVTASFCSLNRVSMVLRSHEAVSEGFQFMHDDKLLTVFTASRYCGRGTNRGAIIVFDVDMNYAVHQFMAGELADCSPVRTPPVLGIMAGTSKAFEVGVAVAQGRLPSSGGADNTKRPISLGSRTSSTGQNRPQAQAEAAQADAVRKMLVERICLRKSDLYFYYSTADRGPSGGKDGKITKLVWADGMRTVLDLDLPWLTLFPLLTHPEADGRVNYTRFLDRYRIAMRSSDLAWIESLTEKLAARLFAATSSLEAAYASLDTDGSGELELDEMEKGLAKLGLGLSKQQLYELVTSLDTDKDGRISLVEFKSRFQLTFSRLTDEKRAGRGTGGAPAGKPMDEWTKAAMRKVGQALFKGEAGTNAPSVFAAVDANKDGLVSLSEWDTVLARLGLGYSAEERKKLFEVVDANGSGTINYLEFVQGFKVEEVAGGGLQLPASSPAHAAWDGTTAQASAARKARDHVESKGQGYDAAGRDERGSASGSAPWQRAVVDKIISVLYEYRVEMAACFNMFDTDRSGKISSKEFRVGLQALTSLTGSPITDEQADELLKALDKDGDGEIDFQEFIEGFALQDSMAPPKDAPPVTASLIRKGSMKELGIKNSR